MRKDGKVAKTVYVGAGVKSIEWVDPPAKKAPKAVKAEKKTDKKDA